MADVIGRIIDQGGEIYNFEAPNFRLAAPNTVADEINSAIQYVQSNGGGTLFFNQASYAIDKPLLVGSSPNPVQLVGRGFSVARANTKFMATTAMSHLLQVNSENTEVLGIQLDASRKANYALYLLSSNFSRFNIYATGALLDGIHLTAGTPRVHYNDNIVFERCFSTWNGTVHATANAMTNFYTTHGWSVTDAPGKVSVELDSQIVKGTDTKFLSLGARQGDIIRIGSDYYQIAEPITSDIELKVGIRKTPKSTASGLDYAVLVGNGYREERFLDNNINIFLGGLWRRNAAAGLFFNGLYGPSAVGIQVDENAGYGIVLGATYGDGIVFRSSFVKPYFEDNLAASILFAGAKGFTVLSPEWENEPAKGFPKYQRGHLDESYGVILGDDKIAVEAIGRAVPVGMLSSANRALKGRNELGNLHIGTTGENLYLNWDETETAAAANVIIGNGKGEERVRIMSTGRIGLGTSSPQNGLHILGRDGIRIEDNALRYGTITQDENGNFNIGSSTGQAVQFVTNGSVRWRTDSDGHTFPLTNDAYTLGKLEQSWHKVYSVNGVIQSSDPSAKNVQDVLDAPTALEAIRSIPVHRFTYKNDPENRPHVGVMVTDLPSWLRTEETGLNYASIASLALAGVQAVDEELAAVRQRITDLEMKLGLS